jgi:Ca2+-binding EF-hand superfamily protein
MITELHERKYDKLFRFLDVNLNGMLEFEDMLAYAARITSAFDVAPTAPKAQALVDALQLFWDTLLSSLDLDGDRRISPEEWRAGMTVAFLDDMDGFVRAIRPTVLAAAAMVDTDGDGVVSRTEFVRAGIALGVTQEDKEAAFDHLDIDGNGSLSIDEIVEAIRDFVMSEDPDVRGNWAYGPI